MNASSTALLRASLVFVWFATAIVSGVELNGQSRTLLDGLPTAWRGVPWLSTAIILTGAGADALLGLWLAFKPGRYAYWAALMVMAVMSVVATAIHPAWWLHPLGPLTKNIPIAAILWVLLQNERILSLDKKSS